MKGLAKGCLKFGLGCLTVVLVDAAFDAFMTKKEPELVVPEIVDADPVEVQE